MKDFNHPGALYVKGEALYHLGNILLVPMDVDFCIGKTLTLQGI